MGCGRLQKRGDIHAGYVDLRREDRRRDGKGGVHLVRVRARERRERHEEGDGVVDALREMLEVARALQTPLEVSHLKIERVFLKRLRDLGDALSLKAAIFARVRRLRAPHRKICRAGKGAHARAGGA